GVGLMDAHRARRQGRRERRELQGAALAPAGPGRFPLGELSLEQLDQLLRRGLADRREQPTLLLAPRRVEAERVFPLEGIDVPAKAWRGVPVGMAGPVAERDHRPPCDVAGLVQV